MSVQTKKPFDINQHLQENSVVEVVEEHSKESESFSFYNLVNKVNDEMKKKYDDGKLSDEEMSRRQLLEHQGALGIKKAENLLISEIETYLRDYNLLGVKYPDFYNSLAHGIFHEIYRFGTFYKWESFPESPSAKIVGKEIWFKINGKFIKQEEELRSDEHINEIIRLLQIGDSNFKVNEANPQDEIILNDGVRIKVMIPPLANQPTIVFRRFIVSSFSFQKQANLNTIPFEDIPLYETMANLYLNTIIAGQVESGKSTMLKTFYGARDKDKVAVLIETSPESFLKRDFPERLVHELYTDKNGDIHKIMRDVLRIDHDYVIVQEVRGIEAEGALEATSRGTRGTLMTYHITDPRRTAEQLAQHIVDEFPNRKIVNEIRRVASQIDIGITMGTYENNQKMVTSIYELCYDFEKDKAWINYLVKFDKDSGTWKYNSNVSEQLKERMFVQDKQLAEKFLNYLERRNSLYPLTDENQEVIHFKE